MTETQEDQYDYNDEEKLRTKRICVYLRDLRDRIKNSCQQHNAAIQNSVSLLKEINDVSHSLVRQIDAGSESAVRIKKLIFEYESVNAFNKVPSKPHAIDLSRDDLATLQQLKTDFENLDSSHLLHETLLLCKRAKDSFEKIDAVLDTFGSDTRHLSPNSSDTLKGCNSNNLSLREKIHMFNKALEHGENAPHQFESCFNKNTAVESNESIYESAFDLPNTLKIAQVSSTAQSGYEGDIDSDHIASS